MNWCVAASHTSYCTLPSIQNMSVGKWKTLSGQMFLTLQLNNSHEKSKKCP